MLLTISSSMADCNVRGSFTMCLKMTETLSLVLFQKHVKSVCAKHLLDVAAPSLLSANAFDAMRSATTLSRDRFASRSRITAWTECES